MNGSVDSTHSTCKYVNYLYVPAYCSGDDGVTCNSILFLVLVLWWKLFLMLSGTLDLFINSYDPDFQVTCGLGGCIKQYRNYGLYWVHL